MLYFEKWIKLFHRIFAIFVKDNGVMKKIILSIYNFYADGFKNMTWGKSLWILIILKVVILFLLLRIFFFRPTMAGKTDEQKSEYVGTQLIRS